jgi:hypothetical protein
MLLWTTQLKKSSQVTQESNNPLPHSQKFVHRKFTEIVLTGIEDANMWMKVRYSAGMYNVTPWGLLASDVTDSYRKHPVPNGFIDSKYIGDEWRQYRTCRHSKQGKISQCLCWLYPELARANKNDFCFVLWHANFHSTVSPRLRNDVPSHTILGVSRQPTKWNLSSIWIHSRSYVLTSASHWR